MTSSHGKKIDNAKSKSVWGKTPVANLIKYNPPGVYFARVRLRNRLYRASLKTTVMSVAKLKLADFVKERQAVSPDGEILGKMTKTKNGKPRSIPVIADMRALLSRLKSETPEAGPEDPVLLVNSCEEAMTRACKKVGMDRIVHHDLRHLFATRCLECGVYRLALPRAARWRGAGT
jgi:integrase